jgi:hypothetical protein
VGIKKTYVISKVDAVLFRSIVMPVSELNHAKQVKIQKNFGF